MRAFTLGTLAGGVALVCGFLVAGARGDEIVKTNGQVVRGRVVTETADAVVIEVKAGAMTMRQKVARAHVKSVRRDARQGPGYCVVPIGGELGVAVTADALRDALAAARAAGATVVALAIDSDGGDLIAAEEIARVVAEASAAAGGPRFVGVVTRATGAAAVVAVACPEIHLLPGARLAADVPAGKSTASLHREIRIAARTAGHHPDWVAGVLGPDGAQPTRAAEKPAVKRLSHRAADGAASPVADWLAVRDSMGLDAWHEVDDRPRQIMAYAAGAEDRARAAAEREERAREEARRTARAAWEERRARREAMTQLDGHSPLEP